MTKKIRHFIDLDEFSKIDFRELLDSCHQRKNSKNRNSKAELDIDPVSYTHLTLPTIYSV